MSQIPNRLHFCFGFSPDFSNQPWGLVHFACVKSAVVRIKPQHAVLSYEYEPYGPWWDLTKSLIDVEKIVAPREIFGRPLMHAAHRADVFRLQRLLKHGGIYLDCDVLVVRDFEPLRVGECVLGGEGVGDRSGVSNAVILAKDGAPFIRRWLESYRSFRSRGHDAYWNEHSIITPKQLASNFPNEVTLLDHKAFCWPLWTDDHIKWMFASTKDLNAQGAFAHHLWESCSWIEYMANLSVRRVRSVDTNFHRMIRPLIADVPEEFAAPSWRAVSANTMRRAVLTSRKVKAGLKRMVIA